MDEFRSSRFFEICKIMQKNKIFCERAKNKHYFSTNFFRFYFFHIRSNVTFCSYSLFKKLPRVVINSRFLDYLSDNAVQSAVKISTNGHGNSIEFVRCIFLGYIFRCDKFWQKFAHYSCPRSREFKSAKKNPRGRRYARMQIESPGAEHDGSRTDHPGTIINPGDPPGSSATKERERERE